MKKQIVGIVACVLLFGTLVPVAGVAVEDETAYTPKTEAMNPNTLEYMLFAHVVASGTGSCTTFGGTFILGFGACWAMIITLEDDGYIELTSLTDPSDSVTLEGSYRVFTLGFMGLRWNVPRINVNGIGLFTLCV